MPTTVDLTGAQAQSIHTALGSPQMIYSTNPPTPPATEPTVAQYAYIEARAAGLVFTPRQANGTPLTEAQLLAQNFLPAPIKVNAVA